MKKRTESNLWPVFVAIIFCVMVVTATIMIIIIFFVKHLGYLDFDGGNALIPITFLLLLSAIIGTALSVFVGRHILNPLTNFSKVSRQVAQGNFDIIMEDTSQLKEIREFTKNFNLMIRELASIETLRTDFVMNVSHEFKTPIAAIEGYATLLQAKDLSTAERDEYTQMIISSTRQLASLSGNILTLSKLENQEMLLERNTFRLDEQIRQAILFLETQWSSKKLELMIELPKVTYFGSEHLLMQVWINLISNAIKYSPEQSQITIDLSIESGETIFTVSDQGCGIEPQAIGHIFDKFFQADRTRKSEGNGLGLTLVKRIVELSGARISVTSQPEKGSTFIVVLP